MLQGLISNQATSALGMSDTTTPETNRHGKRNLTPEAKQDKDKVTRRGSNNAVFEVDDFPGLPKPETSHMSQSQSTVKAPLMPCLCGGSMTKKTVKVKCATCTRVWHSDCVGLKGGSEYLLKKLEENGWNCPKCFIFAEPIQELFKTDDIVIEPNELEKVSVLINREINLVIPKVVAGVEEKIKEGCFDQVFKDAGRVVSNSWVDIARSDQKKVINEAVQATTDVALQQSMQLIDSNLTERKRRTRNVIITNIPENSVGANLKEVICHHLGEELHQQHILSCNRLGKLKENPLKPRAILCVMLREDDAVYFSNNGKGRRFTNNVWVNPDLTRAERDVLFHKREEKKRLRNRPTSTEQPLINLDDDRRSVSADVVNHNVPAVSEEQTIVGQVTEPAEVNNNMDHNGSQPDTVRVTPDVTDAAAPPPAAAKGTTVRLNEGGVGSQGGL